MSSKGRWRRRRTIPESLERDKLEMLDEVLEKLDEVLKELDEVKIILEPEERKGRREA